MAHKRESIRKALVAMLSTPVGDVYPTDAGANVYANRVTPVWKDVELPMIKIYFGIEEATPRALNSRQYIRTAPLIAEVLAEVNEELDDVLDDLAKQIEDIVSANPSLNSTATGTVLRNSEPSFDDGGEKLIGKLIITFETKYIE